MLTYLERVITFRSIQSYLSGVDALKMFPVCGITSFVELLILRAFKTGRDRVRNMVLNVRKNKGGIE
jgi:hypothetical protein